MKETPPYRSGMHRSQLSCCFLFPAFLPFVLVVFLHSVSSWIMPLPSLPVHGRRGSAEVGGQLAERLVVADEIPPNNVPSEKQHLVLLGTSRRYDILRSARMRGAMCILSSHHIRLSDACIALFISPSTISNIAHQAAVTRTCKSSKRCTHKRDPRGCT